MMADTSVEISVKGKWGTVPSLEVDGNILIVTGRSWIRVARIHAEEWLEGELEHPAVCIDRLRGPEGRRLRADVLSFSQKLPFTHPRYPYPMEWESVATLHITSFKEWWERLPQESRKNVRRSQKRAVVVEVKALDDELVRGIVEVNNDSPLRQGVPFAHYGKTHDEVKKDQSSFLERSDFVCAYLGTELIGFLKLV